MSKKKNFSLASLLHLDRKGILFLNKTGGARDLLFFVLSVDSQKANVFNLAGLNIANWEKFFHCVGPAIASLLDRTLLWSLSTVKDSSSCI